MASSIDLAIDTSALTAVLLREPEARRFLQLLTATPRVGLCAANRTEFLVVVQARLGDFGVERAKQFLQMQQVLTIPLDHELADLAVDGYRRFGKGRHQAGLNYGDCFAYALAIREQVPLLFTGDDFRQTDARSALPS